MEHEQLRVEEDIARVLELQRSLEVLFCAGMLSYSQLDRGNHGLAMVGGAE